MTKPVLNQEITDYNQSQSADRQLLCERLATIMCTTLPNHEYKLWHGAPVWFSDGNPIVGYDVLKDGVRVLFWSGQSFDEPKLQPEGSFKAAEIRYTDVDQVDEADLKRWLGKAESIQWDYKNIVKRKGKLERLR